MTKRGAEFLKKLQVLCDEHRVQLCVDGYDNIELHDKADTDPALWCPAVEDYLSVVNSDPR